MLTRSVARFRSAASTAERLCRAAGLEVDSETVDTVVRTWVARVALEHRVSERSALAYAPTNLGKLVADTIVEADRHRQPLRPQFDRDAIVYVQAPPGGGACSRCDEPIPTRTSVALVPGPNGRDLAHPGCLVIPGSTPIDPIDQAGPGSGDQRDDPPPTEE